MHYGELKKCDIANGIGVRVTLFVSGCTNRCPDCFQPQTWDFDFGKEFTEDTKAEIFAELDKPFPQEEELKNKSARLAELDAELNMDQRPVSREKSAEQER